MGTKAIDSTVGSLNETTKYKDTKKRKEKKKCNQSDKAYSIGWWYDYQTAITSQMYIEQIRNGIMLIL